MKKSKEIPRFKSEAEERKFWRTQDSTDFVDWGQAEILAFPNLRPTMKTISLRLPEFVLDELRAMAQKKRCLLSVVDQDFHQGSHRPGA